MAGEDVGGGWLDHRGDGGFKGMELHSTLTGSHPSDHGAVDAIL